jgi:hypothetical protein
MKQRVVLLAVSFFLLLNNLDAQSWIVKDSILVFPEGFSSWLKRNNGGIDSANPGPGNSMGMSGIVGTNQGIDLFDFNKDGLPDLTFQLFPSNNVTREYLKGIFIQNRNGKFILDTNYVIKAKGDMWLGGFGDFNGDGLNDYHYIIQNYHGADSNRKYSPEMIYDHWPEKVFINNGKSFDTITLDVDNLTVESTYVADIDKDGSDEIIAADRGPNYINIYKYDKVKKRFYKIFNDISTLWNSRFNPSVSRYPLFNVVGTNSQNEFSVILFDSSNSKELNEPDWQPYNFKKFTLAKYNFNTKQLETTTLNRDSILIPIKYSKQDADDYYRFSIHEKLTAYQVDIDKNGEDEIVVGGFYMNNYFTNKLNRFAYGWKVLGLNGKDLTSQFFKDSGIDRGTEILPLGLDIDENADGIEFIPGTWGLQPKQYIDGSPTLGYYYKIVNGKFEKTTISDLKHETGKKLDSSYFNTMNIIKYPNFIKNKNALIIYDFSNIKRTAIIYQASCLDVSNPTFEKLSYSICGSESINVKVVNLVKTDTINWYVNGKLKINNTADFSFNNADTVYVKKNDINGCVKYSDTIIIKKIPQPTTPIITRDTSNNLVSSSTYGNVWIKEGVILSDTTQKLKPNSAGLYSVKTNQNNCTSLVSNPYYYLVTDILRLNSEEFIKLTPNPFINFMNIDFVIKGYQRLNIEVFSGASGVKVASRLGVTAGSRLVFSELNPGVYFMSVSSPDFKVSHQFKMVKF